MTHVVEMPFKVEDGDIYFDVETAAEIERNNGGTDLEKKVEAMIRASGYEKGVVRFEDNEPVAINGD